MNKLLIRARCKGRAPPVVQKVQFSNSVLLGFWGHVGSSWHGSISHPDHWKAKGGF